MTATTKRTWSQVIIQNTGVEIWTCGRAMNQRPNLTVLLVGSTRYRADRRERTSVAKLTADGWAKR